MLGSGHSERSTGARSAPLLRNRRNRRRGQRGRLHCSRSLRGAIGTLGYVWVVYSIAACCSSSARLRRFAAFDIGRRGLTFVLAMAVGLSSGIRRSITRRGAWPTLVSVAILGEPVLSAAFAWALLGEDVAPLQLCGFAITLAEFVLRGRRSLLCGAQTSAARDRPLFLDRVAIDRPGVPQQPSRAVGDGECDVRAIQTRVGHVPGCARTGGLAVIF
jgi:hypothetical protein